MVKRINIRGIFKILVIVVLVAPFFWFGISLMIYRLPSQEEPHLFDSEIHYKFLELDLTNRGFFENIFSNRITRLEGNSTLYVSMSDHKKLWPENPHEMYKNGYSYKARLSASPLLFGGFGPAKVITVVRIPKKPIISK